MSLKVVLFKSLGAVSYSLSIVTMAVSVAFFIQYQRVANSRTDGRTELLSISRVDQHTDAR